MKYITNKDFVHELENGTLDKGVILTGMVKSVQDSPDSFYFSPNMDCEAWIKIPLRTVEEGSIQVLGESKCFDNKYPIVILELVRPKSEDAIVLYNLLEQHLSSELAIGNRPASNLESTLADTIFRIEIGADPPSTGINTTVQAQKKKRACTDCITDRSHPFFGHVMCCDYRRTDKFPWIELIKCESGGTCIAHQNPAKVPDGGFTF